MSDPEIIGNGNDELYTSAAAVVRGMEMVRDDDELVKAMWDAGSEELQARGYSSGRVISALWGAAVAGEKTRRGMGT